MPRLLRRGSERGPATLSHAIAASDKSKRTAIANRPNISVTRPRPEGLDAWTVAAPTWFVENMAVKNLFAGGVLPYLDRRGARYQHGGGRRRMVGRRRRPWGQRRGRKLSLIVLLPSLGARCLDLSGSSKRP